jgi:ribose-phosphate pyrophosphokinase
MTKNIARNGEGHTIILADPNTNPFTGRTDFTGSYNYDFAKRVYESLHAIDSGYEFGEVNIKYFEDTDLEVHLPKSVRGKHCVFIHDACKFTPSWYTELTLVGQVIGASSGKETTFILPKFKLSRSDQMNVERTSVGAAAVAKEIRDYGNRIVTIDIHNRGIIGSFLQPPITAFDNLDSFPIAVEYFHDAGLLENAVIVSPDDGGTKRARAFSARAEDIIEMRTGTRIEVPHTNGLKFRDSSGKVKEIRIDYDFKDKIAIVVDDELGTGGTANDITKLIYNQGAIQVAGYFSHGLFTKGIGNVDSRIDPLVVLDTVPNTQIASSERVEVLSIAPYLAEVIDRICTGGSISALGMKEESEWSTNKNRRTVVSKSIEDQV